MRLGRAKTMRATAAALAPDGDVSNELFRKMIP